MDKYVELEKIGEGNFGVVHKCRKLKTNEIVAIKTILFHESEGIPSSVMREINLLQKMNHPNIVKLLDVLGSDNKVSLVLEYVEHDLEKFILLDPSKVRDPQVIKRILHNILSGVQYCHKNSIIHRDLKLNNLLINSEDRVVKLADFGLARTIDTPPVPLTKRVGNLYNMAPEILIGSTQYSTPVDIWAVGCMFAETVIHEKLFAGDSDRMLGRIARIIGTPDEEIWPGGAAVYPVGKDIKQYPPKNLAEVVPGLEPAGIDLLSRMLRWNPSDRITAAGALAHEYFHDIPAET